MGLLNEVEPTFTLTSDPHFCTNARFRLFHLSDLIASCEKFIGPEVETGFGYANHGHLDARRESMNRINNGAGELMRAKLTSSQKFDDRLGHHLRKARRIFCNRGQPDRNREQIEYIPFLEEKDLRGLSAGCQ